MTAEYLLHAIGLLDDDLVAQAEAPASAGRTRLRRTWASLAACLALCAAIGWGVMFLSMDGGESGAAAGGANESSAAGSPAPGGAEADEEGGPSPMIRLDGVLYQSTGVAVPGEVEESASRFSPYAPEGLENGQNNFAPQGAAYAFTAHGLVVLMDDEWVLFIPVE